MFGLGKGQEEGGYPGLTDGRGENMHIYVYTNTLRELLDRAERRVPPRNVRDIAQARERQWGKETGDHGQKCC